MYAFVLLFTQTSNGFVTLLLQNFTKTKQTPKNYEQLVNEYYRELVQ